jgi:hypothetical protein
VPENIDMPNLTAVQAGAFASATGLKSISLPLVTGIG